MPFTIKTMVDLVEIIINVTKRGQITLPESLRLRYDIGDKLVLEEQESGLLLKPFPSLYEEIGSLKGSLREEQLETFFQKIEKFLDKK